MPHSFATSLALSKEQEDAPWWAEVYGRAFPGHLSAVSVRNDGWAQRGGIDRVVTLKSGKTVTIDEKVRAQDWPDIALERWSDRDRRAPGWVQKDLACDFIAYAFVPSRRCYLFPFQALRRAWVSEGKAWCDQAESNQSGFHTVLAKNSGYTTESVAVPIPVLLASIQRAMVISWGAA